MIGPIFAATLEVSAQNEVKAQLQHIRRPRPTNQRDGWSDRTWDLARSAASVRKDPTLRDAAAALLIGLDARKVKSFKFGASSVAFDSTGKRLLMGGHNKQGARLWNGGLENWLESKQPGGGPVVFRGELPLQLAAAGPNQLVLWDIKKQGLVHELSIPGKGLNANGMRLALSRDGNFAAAAFVDEQGKEAIAVWDTNSARLIHTFSSDATVIAFSSNGAQLAVGRADGSVQVWKLPKGEVVAELHLGRNAITALAFGRATVFRGAEDDGVDELLAVGDVGATITVWDLQKKLPRTFFHGSWGEVLGLAFSPDGVTLASTGRGYVQLWNLSDGQMLLKMAAGNIVTGLDISPDGGRIAVSHVSAFDYGAGVDVWEVADGRGIQSLRGLGSPVWQVRFSADGRWLAAISYDWKIGVWDVKTGRIVRLLDAPQGDTPDNAALILNADGSKLACAAGREARVWDLSNGRVIDRWELPAGSIDRLVFHPSGKLLSFRAETSDPDVRPFGTDADRYPRVGRLRDFLPDGHLREIATIRSFNHQICLGEISPNGEYVVVDGYGGEAGTERRTICFDPLTGKERWSIPVNHRQQQQWLMFDTDSRLLVALLRTRNDQPTPKPCDVLDPRTGRVVQHSIPIPYALSSNAGFLVYDNLAQGGIAIHRGYEAKPLVNLGIDDERWGIRYEFDRDGSHFAWSNNEGSIFVADLLEVQGRLASIDMGW